MSKVWLIRGMGSDIGSHVQKLRNALLRVAIAAFLAGSCSAYAQETPIQVAIKDGQTIAQFRVGDSRCLLVNDEIRCTPVGK